jgi:hypothetical protein
MRTVFGDPRYLVLNQDGIYDATVTRRLRAMGIRDKPIAAGSPWQNAYAERLIGTIRRECLDHMIVFGETQLRRTLSKYAAYYNETRTHDPWARIHHSIERSRTSALSDHSLCWAAFIINIVESDFRYAQRYCQRAVLSSIAVEAYFRCVGCLC